MENKFYKVFCGALAFGIVAMIMLTIVLCCGIYCCILWWSVFAACVAFSIVLSSVILHLFNKNVNREYDNALKDKDKEIGNLKKEIEKLKQPSVEIQKDNMTKHEEKMALIKQLGKDAANAEIIDILKSKYFDDPESTENR